MPLEAPAAPTLFTPANIKWGVGIVLVIAIIYIIGHVGAFMSSPMGQALSKAMGAAATLLTALASLPTWLLVGLGFAYLLGPAIMKMSGRDTRAVADAAVKGNETAKAKKAAGATDEDVEAFAAGKATKMVEIVRTKQSQESGGDVAKQEAAAQAQQNSAETAAAAAAESPSAAANDAAGREEASRDIPYEDID